MSGAAAVGLGGSAPTFAVVGTFLLAVGFYALTAHVAARFVLGTVPVTGAVRVGAVAAAATTVLQSLDPAPLIGLALIADAGAIHVVYRRRPARTAAVTAVHFAVSAILGITIYNLVRLIGTAPG